MSLCRAEREFFTIVKRGSWNELGPHCRLSLLRDCAVQHIEWSHFTPHCQLWVLNEIARVSTEGVNDAVGAGAKAIAPLRLKNLVKANPIGATELSDICETNLLLPRVADKLRVELRAHEQSVLRASSGSPRSPGRPGTGSTIASTATRKSNRKMHASHSSGFGFTGSPSVTQQSEPVVKRRGRKAEPEATLKPSASAPDMRKGRTDRLAPLLRKTGTHTFGSKQQPSVGSCHSGDGDAEGQATMQSEAKDAGPK